MKSSELKKDPMIIEFLAIMNPRPNTEKNYIQALQSYTEFTGKDPETLILEAEEEIRAGKLMRQRSIKKHLITYRQHLQESGKSPNTVRIHLSGVKVFYKAFDIEIPNLPRSGKARVLEKNKEIPTKEDLQEVLKVVDPLEKAILLTGAASGLSANDLCRVTVGDFKKGYDSETEITTLALRREKVGFDFITFLTPEASRAVWDYLEFRSRRANNNEKKRLEQLEKQRISKDSNLLFIKRQIIPEYLNSMDESLRALNGQAIGKIYRTISEKARKGTPAGDWGIIRSHNVRKAFNSAMLNAGADSFFVEFLMGHTLDDTRGAYFRASPEKLREIYQNFIPYLTVSKEADVSESPEFQKMKTENKALQAELVTKAVDRSELSELRKELEELKNAEKLKAEAKEHMDPEWMKVLVQKIKEEMGE